MQIGAVERRSARHAAHREHLQLYAFAGQIGVGLVPIDLRFHAPRIALRHAGLAHQHSQRNLALVHVLPNRSFSNLAIRQLVLNPLPDAMGRMPLLARRFSIGFKHSVHEVDRSLQLPSRPFGLLPRPRQRASDRLAHHAAMYTDSLGLPSTRAYSDCALPTALIA